MITPIDETLRALDDLRSQGLIRYFGVSNWHAWRIAKALGLSEARNCGRFESVQAYYSIASRDVEREIVPLVEAERLGLMVWSPLAGGLLSGKFGPGATTPEGARRTTFDFPPVNAERVWPIVAAMREIGAAKGASVAQVALAWLLAKPHVMSVIVGVRDAAQLDENLAAVQLSLTPGELETLDGISAQSRSIPAGCSDSFATVACPSRTSPNRATGGRRRRPATRSGGGVSEEGSHSGRILTWSCRAASEARPGSDERHRELRKAEHARSRRGSSWAVLGSNQRPWD